MRYEPQRFARRFNRGLSSTVAADTAESGGFVERVCSECHALCKGYEDEPKVLCFDCSHKRNPYGNVYLSIESGGDDSTDPRRIKDGSSIYNVGLRGVDTVIGKNPDGTDKLSYRPVTHNELGTNRRVREYAKRTGCTQLETPKRAIGGRAS